jgi:hypothetical protein
MTTDKTTLIHEIASAFSLSDEAAQTACLLLEARARTLDYTFDEYMQRYHPEGFAEKDETLGGQWQGYVQFLGDDATAILRAGKSANFSTLVHECAHVFRRQLTGELREQAEKAFGIEGGTWNVEKEELFAKGLEKWIKRKHRRDKTRADVYNKGKNFVDTVYRGMERIVEIDSRMEEVYERLFDDSKYIFKQNKYEETLAQIAEGKLPKDSHIFLGMTPRIYEELGFQRLPMAITNAHLYTTLRSSGLLPEFNYHDLGEDILRQLPKQLKNPLLIVQSSNDEAEIISVIGLTDKKGDTIIVPVAQYQKGNVNGAEIDINLVKSTYGKKGFENWLKEAVEDNRLLYIDKKKTEPIWMGQGFRQVYQHFPDRAILPPELKPPDVLQNISGFLPENIAHFQEAVKRKFPERFAPSGERILYQSKRKRMDDNQRFETGGKLSDSESRKQSAYENYATIQEKYITALANAKRGEKTKIKNIYEPLLDKAGKAYGSEAKESIKLYNALRTDLEEGWGRTTVNNPGGKQFIDGEIQKYVNGKQTNEESQLETARKTGYVQGVCESVAAVSGDKKMAVKLLSEMNVNRDTAKKFANPETYKTLEKGIFAQKPEQKLEQTHSIKR